ncbi:root allergen protein-like [Cynara cardunculus var. scolymus]|uniref:Bet v I domain-containing protein n=1 Tax=Cynara cardunculus var. scolymus TaxID=59895 RepID=A0A103XSP5_CYNCS|nr:root allergen protein-like [Cynara cardunculus var. scolymus]KVH96134.1 Bet v I domain-containing protein [Cynara cardunculus var. scolymus]
MAVVTSELEVPSSVSASKLFKAFLDFRNLAPKVEPESFKAIDYIKGDGGIGTIQQTTFVDGSKTKLTVDAIDHTNFSLSTTIFEGGEWMDNLESATYHAKFVPSTTNDGSTYKVSSVYKCKDPAKFTEENAKFADEYTKKTFKAIEAYIVANPNAY